MVTTKEILRLHYGNLTVRWPRVRTGDGHWRKRRTAAVSQVDAGLSGHSGTPSVQVLSNVLEPELGELVTGLETRGNVPAPDVIVLVLQDLESIRVYGRPPQ